MTVEKNGKSSQFTVEKNQMCDISKEVERGRGESGQV